MLAIVVELRIKPAFVEAFERAIVANATASRETEPGSVSSMSAVTQPIRIVLPLRVV